MKTLSSAEIQELMQDTGEICVSIYLPRHHDSAGLHQDQVVLKNLLKDAEQHLLQQGWRASEIEKLLAPAYALPDDELFWQQDAQGVALFFTLESSRQYMLPRPVEPLCVVAHHFYILPLLALDTNHLFYVLALSRNHVRLLQGTPYNIAPVEIKGLPSSLEQALEHEVAEKQSGFRPLPASAGGGRQAIFYGQGAGPDDERDELVRYFRVIDAALHEHLKETRAPLVLAAVEHLFPLYREANTYPHLAAGGIRGNPDDSSAEQLGSRARELVQPQFKQAQLDALARYHEMAGTGLTSDDLEETVRAAFEGRVAVLFVNRNARKWGHLDPATGTIVVQPLAKHDGEELLNLAAIFTLADGGQVYFVEPKTLGPGEFCAALLRY